MVLVLFVPTQGGSFESVEMDKVSSKLFFVCLAPLWQFSSFRATSPYSVVPFNPFSCLSLGMIRLISCLCGLTFTLINTTHGNKE